MIRRCAAAQLGVGRTSEEYPRDPSTHAGPVASVLSGTVDGVDDQHVDDSARRDELQPELLLQCRKQIRPVVRRGTGRARWSSGWTEHQLEVVIAGQSGLVENPSAVY